jgi:hypothetical protein
MSVNLIENLDIFSVKSMYADIINGHTVFLREYIWMIKVPMMIKKIKIFMWFLYTN